MRTAAPAPPILGSASNEQLILQYDVERFYHYEADLLDQRQFDRWLDLLSDDIRYWMPLSRNFSFGNWQDEHTREGKDLNWFDEGKFELVQRVKQINTGKHWSEEPLSRTTHAISNIDVHANNEQQIDAHCRFIVYRNRSETEWDLFVGKRRDVLKIENGQFKITRRSIFLDQNVLLAKNLTIFF